MSVVLILTSKEDRTAALVEKELQEQGTEFLHLNTETFGTDFQIDFLAQDSTLEILIRTREKEINGKDVNSIWFRRPLPPQPSQSIVDSGAREFAAAELRSLLDGALYALDCQWVSHPSAIRSASHKLYQLRAALNCGFNVPETCVSMDPIRVKDFCHTLHVLGKRSIAKLVSQGPPRASVPDEQYSVFTALLGDEDLVPDSTLAICPAIYQEYVDKKYELRVTVVGESAFACEIHSQATGSTRVDWRRYDIPNTPHLPHKLNSDIETKCIAITKYFGLSFSAIDLIVRPDGQVVFLEMNPNGQWGWIEELTGLPISRTLANYLAGRK